MGSCGRSASQFLRGREPKAPPPQAIAATVVAIDGLLASAVGTTILVGLLGRTYDHSVGIDALVAKNLVYFFGHSIANLTLYLIAAAIYVLVPRYAGRPYTTTKPFVAGWMGSLVFIATAYSHHLYMDFVQPTWAAIISETVSYAALIPVAVVTIYSMTMLVWGSRYRWTLASTLLYIGLAGWAIGGTGAVIDSVIPINFRFHNTDWVIAHFHTYLILGVVVWGVAFLAHLLERDADRSTSPAARTWTVAALLIGGFGLTGTWFVEGVLGVPRRFAIQPPGTHGYNLAGSRLLAPARRRLPRPLPPTRATRPRRPASAGSRAKTRRPSTRRDVPAGASRPQAPPNWLSVSPRAWLRLACLLPPGRERLRGEHALPPPRPRRPVLRSAPCSACCSARSPPSHNGSATGPARLVTVLAAPALMMLVMVPAIYEPLERHSFEHALYHLAMAAFGLLTGLGATRLGLVAGRLMLRSSRRDDTHVRRRNDMKAEPAMNDRAAATQPGPDGLWRWLARRPDRRRPPSSAS